MHRVPHEFGGVTQMEFPHDVGSMRFHSLDTQMQRVGNLSSTQPAPDKLQDFELSVAQAREW